MNQLAILTILFRLWFSLLPVAPAQSTEAVVRAVLFYSPTCGHCHLVITEVLPPLFEKYGDQLYIVGVDVSQPSGSALFSAALQYFNLESGGVPFLVVGDTYLVGSLDIPEQFPGLIEQYLAQGGVDWPAIPGMAEAMSAAEQAQQAEESASPTATAPAPAAETPAATPTASMPQVTEAFVPTPGLVVTGQTGGGLGANFANDWLGNTLAVLVLIAMLVASVKALHFWKQPSGDKPIIAWKWAIPVLCLVGLGVAGYLAYVETTQVEAVCGPVGDCNTVQQSAYAHLFGVLPIGILGVIGYVMILTAWGLAQAKSTLLAAYAAVAQLGMAAFGVLFSIYLTFLEPFVIGATCAWCLTSAVLMTIVMWLSLPSGRRAWAQLKRT